MKKLAILTSLFCIFSLMLSAQIKTDKELIEQTIQLYFDGWAVGDTTQVGKAMHATCHLKYFRDNKFSDVTRATYLSNFKPKERDKALKTAILSLDITGNIAAAKTEIATGKFIFIDYFNLIKTDEGWFIVDKISTRKDK